MFAYETKPGASPAGEFLFCALASVVDALVTVSIYGSLAQISVKARRPGFYLAAAFIGAWCAVFFELLARFFNLWSYNRRMIVIPLLETGILPFLQLTLLVPLAIWLAETATRGARRRDAR